MLMLLGFVFGMLLWWFKGESSHVSQSAFVHDVIYYLLLPPIIYEAGFTMRKRKFFANFGMILLYAVIGTLVAILAAGALLYGLVQAGAIDTDYRSTSSCSSPLISSTDPISTLATLKAVKAKPPLEDLIFGESALNDALSIVFNVFPPSAARRLPNTPQRHFAERRRSRRRRRRDPQQILNMGRMLLIILPCSPSASRSAPSAAITRHSPLRGEAARRRSSSCVRSPRTPSPTTSRSACAALGDPPPSSRASRCAITPSQPLPTRTGEGPAAPPAA